jgi:asparagine synthase (glutamine-hydrolysing)
MCGITGMLSSERVKEEDIARMSDCIAHRGPDAQGIFMSESGTAALGHRRLSIIDLSSAANQPMTSGSGRYVIVFNGEIYNFKQLRQELRESAPSLQLRTNSDTEVIVEGYALWGDGICSKLEGMFAFVIFDKSKDELFLCRDRIGKKPLFYFSNRSDFIFASEIKALLKHPLAGRNKTIDEYAVNTFLHLGYIPEPDTIFTKIKKFPAGCFARVRRNHFVQPVSYWSINSNLREFSSLSDQDAIDQLEKLLFKAVEERLISDVPLGAFLSGGTDSSLVVAIASRIKSEPLKTFTIGFKENIFDQREYARKVAKHLSTVHQEYVLSETDSIELLERYINHFDEPFADTSAIPTMLVSKLAKEVVKVALTGDGGDELFLGYGAYDWALRLDNRWVNLFRSPLKTSMRMFGSERMRRLSFFLEETGENQLRSHIFSQSQYLFSQREIQRGTRKWSAFGKTFLYKDPKTDHLNAAEQQAIFDLKYYLKDDLLVKVDRASMLYGLECRSPLLDHRVIEFALTLPFHFKIRGGRRKWILKQLLKKYLPDEMIYRPKWGFSIPLSRWMRNELSYLMENYLSEKVVRELNWVDYAFVSNLKTSFLNGEEFLYNRLWVLIILHKWLSENR